MEGADRIHLYHQQILVLKHLILMAMDIWIVRMNALMMFLVQVLTHPRRDVLIFSLNKPRNYKRVVPKIFETSG